VTGPLLDGLTVRLETNGRRRSEVGAPRSGVGLHTRDRRIRTQGADAGHATRPPDRRPPTLGGAASPRPQQPTIPAQSAPVYDRSVPILQLSPSGSSRGCENGGAHGRRGRLPYPSQAQHARCPRPPPSREPAGTHCQLFHRAVDKLFQFFSTCGFTPVDFPLNFSLRALFSSTAPSTRSANMCSLTAGKPLLRTVTILLSTALQPPRVVA
jgi:hypothetical protein